MDDRDEMIVDNILKFVCKLDIVNQYTKWLAYILLLISKNIKTAAKIGYFGQCFDFEPHSETDKMVAAVLYSLAEKIDVNYAY